MSRYFLLLLGIVLIGSVVRLTLLGDVPVGFHRDEAYLGYNAYSLLLTGKEMTGDMLPLNLRSFLHSPGGYAYLATPFTYLFGLNAFSTRLPSAVFGIATIPLVYLLVTTLFTANSSKKTIGLLSAVLLAVSPWHINLSRVATESVIVVFLITLGVWLYLLGLQKKNLVYIVLAFIAFLVSLGMYQAPRAFLPLFLPVMIFLYRKYLNRTSRLLTIILFFVLIILPVISVVLSPQLSERISMLSVFNHPESRLVLEEQYREDGTSGVSVLLTRIFHNKVVNYGWLVLSNYMSHVSFDFLVNGNALPLRYQLPNIGLLYLFEFFFLLIGIGVYLLKRSAAGLLLLGWFFLTPVISAITFDDIPNMQRTLLIYPALSIIAASGIYFIYKRFENKTYQNVFVVILSFVSLFSVGYFVHQYFIHSVVHRPWNRHEGYEALVGDVFGRYKSYNEVLITPAETEPQIFFLYYGSKDPRIVHTLYDKKGANYKESLGSIRFVKEDCPLIVRAVQTANGIQKVVNGKKGTLYVNHGKCEKIEGDGVRTLREIKRSDNSTIFTILEYTK